MLITAKAVLLLIILGGGAFCFYCQTGARRHVSREKLNALEGDAFERERRHAHRMPAKETLDDEGLKYYNGFLLGFGIVFSSAIVLAVITKLYGS